MSTTPVAPEDLTSISAGLWALRVNVSSTATPNFVPVNGLTSIKPNISPSTQDDTDLDTPGWSRTITTMLGWTVACEGRRKAQSAASTFTPDPGQEFIRLAGEQVFYLNNVEVEFYRREVGGEAYSGVASVQLSERGGAQGDLEPFGFTLTGVGARKQITNPTTGV